MSEHAQVNVSVVLYRTPSGSFDHLYRLIRSSPEVAELTVIDNSPTPCIAHSKYCDIRYEHHPENLGYGAGHNIGLRRSLGVVPYHLVLNPDIEFDPAILSVIRARMDAAPKVGLLMPKVMYPDGRPQYLCRLLPTPLEMVARRFVPERLQAPFRRYLDGHELRFTGYDTEMAVPFLSGCFMFLRTACLQQVGLFDERYFMYAEDLDLSRRVYTSCGTLYFPAVSVTHAHNRSSYKTLRMMLRHSASIVRYFGKWGWCLDKERSALNRAVLRRLVIPV